MARIDTDPVQILNRDKQAAARLVEGVGRAHTFEILKRAQDQLNRRLKQAEGLSGPGRQSYTANQLRQTLLQVRAVTTGLKVGMRDVTTAQGLKAAQQAARAAADYLRASEHKFRGSTRELSLDSARLMDRSVAGAKSSILRRLMSDPKHPARKGILDRYGDAVVGHFEDTLQTAVVARTPWHEVRDQLTEGSPFLQQAPASWAERIVRTETMNAHGTAAHAAIEDAQQQLGDMVKIISSVFDGRTGADSFAVHGQIRRPSESFDSWFGPYMHPPDRPNDRSVVVPHRISWPIPDSLKAKDGGAISARWALEGRSGAPPPQPNITTVPLEQFGKARAPAQPAPDDQPPPEVKPPPVLRTREPAPATLQSMSDASIRMQGLPFHEAHQHFARVLGRELEPQTVKDLVGLGGTGLDLKDLEYTVYTSPDFVQVRANSDDVRIVRQFTRDEEGLNVHHDYFKVEQEGRRTGAGKRVIANQFQQYDQLGVRSVDLSAAWDGQYVWPRMGFEMSSPHQFAAVKDEFSGYLQRTYKMDAKAADRHAQSFDSIHDLAMSDVNPRFPAASLEDLPGLEAKDLHRAGKRFLLHRGNLTDKPMLELRTEAGSSAEPKLRAYLGLKSRP